MFRLAEGGREEFLKNQKPTLVSTFEENFLPRQLTHH